MEAAELIEAQRRLGMGQGVLIANPVPVDCEIPAAEIDGYVHTAMADLEVGGLPVGKLHRFFCPEL